MNHKPHFHYDRNGIRVIDKPVEKMFKDTLDFYFDDTLVEEMMRETQEKFNLKGYNYITEDNNKKKWQ